MTTTTNLLSGFESLLQAVSVDTEGNLYANVSIGGTKTPIKIPGVNVDTATAQKISFCMTMLQLIEVGLGQGHISPSQVPAIQASFGF